MPGIHTKDMARACGAVTVTSNGNQRVKANSKIVAVVGDPNSHGAGNFATNNSKRVYSGGILVINHTPDTAAIDLAGHPSSATITAEGSSNVIVGDA